MELKEIIEKRRSIRKFQEVEVDQEDLREMVRRAGLAPSINNSQPWRFVVITNGGILTQMADTVHNKICAMFPVDGDNNDESVREAVDRFSTFFGNAPAVIAVLNKPYEAIVDNILENTEYSHDEIDSLRNHPNIQTIGAAVENILLSAVDLGYGGCWLTGLLVARKELEKILDVKEPYSIAACVAIGKPDEDPKPKIKKSLEEIFELMD